MAADWRAPRSSTFAKLRSEIVAVRAAVPADIESLVRMRTANAGVHIALDPEAYRIPETDAVVRHFSTLLAEETRGMPSWSRSWPAGSSAWSR